MNKSSRQPKRKTAYLMMTFQPKTMLRAEELPVMLNKTRESANQCLKGWRSLRYALVDDGGRVDTEWISGEACNLRSLRG